MNRLPDLLMTLPSPGSIFPSVLDMPSVQDCWLMPTPLGPCAIEILEYGLIYVFSRVHLDSLGYNRSNDLLRANRINLRVLAPAESYSPGSVEAFEHSINLGLKELRKVEGLDFMMDFTFEQFPVGFHWSGLAETAPAALNARRSVY